MVRRLMVVEDDQTIRKHDGAEPIEQDVLIRKAVPAISMAGTERMLLEEEVTDLIKAPGMHTLSFVLTRGVGAVSCDLEVTW